MEERRYDAEDGDSDDFFLILAPGMLLAIPAHFFLRYTRAVAATSMAVYDMMMLFPASLMQLFLLSFFFILAA